LENTKEEISVPKEVAKLPAWLRLNDQLAWYDKKSVENQRHYNQIKVGQLVLAGATSVFSLAGEV